jgi:hypothetical protein
MPSETLASGGPRTSSNRDRRLLRSMKEWSTAPGFVNEGFSFESTQIGWLAVAAAPLCRFQAELCPRVFPQHYRVKRCNPS